ncbi:indolepyruvate oxidoreductase subunit beta family protein [Sphingomonas alpina]|uniref:Indolepyruvate oxidoreductase subunit beta family protein n=1 Tax=Sphingomonas alpina TaxID=653931 RepID=A0A7H0LG63_9SPHN|nr:indolepyruvate oxidoreductase subunit beta family protein [Sphingomonas alpina]QNQ08666.1 indolepyruvate oxidoreductase subunit beta family protein [Sphingomonas alpina]
MARDRITIAILALGGQGGGVLADWILTLAEANGWRAQGTSVPGVAQRTGSTVYYIEMVPENGSDPVLALMPVPGDVDIVLASELMEGGRAILRGFVSDDRTTLISSTHRIYAISEKTAMGDGTAASDRIVAAAGKRAQKFIGFDMDAAADSAGSVISSILFGALGGSDALPFPRAAFEAAIEQAGIAVPANLRGFAAGFAPASGGMATKSSTSAVRLPSVVTEAPPQPTTFAGQALAARICGRLPANAQVLALHGAARLADYQDLAYAARYLDRLEALAALDDGQQDHALTAEGARHLALWMSYEDTIRVADLKTRADRFARVRGEVRAAPDQLLGVTEFMHPRLREICEVLPAPIGRRILASRAANHLLAPFFTSGRHVETTSLRWFILLRTMAWLRRWRPISLRFVEEQERIDAWLALAGKVAHRDTALAIEVIRCQSLIKGYGDTFDRGLRNFSTLMGLVPALMQRRDAAACLGALRNAALADDAGTALDTAVEAVSIPRRQTTG